MTADFLLASLVVALLPGTGVLYTVSVGLGTGTRAAAMAAIGCTLGVIPHAAASIGGVAAILYTTPLAFLAMKVLGVAYLFWMALGVLRGGAASPQPRPCAPGGDLRLVSDGILLNLLNPKLSVFLIAFLPQFIAPESAHTPREIWPRWQPPSWPSRWLPSSPTVRVRPRPASTSWRERRRSPGCGACSR